MRLFAVLWLVCCIVIQSYACGGSCAGALMLTSPNAYLNKQSITIGYGINKLSNNTNEDVQLHPTLEQNLQLGYNYRSNKRWDVSAFTNVRTGISNEYLVNGTALLGYTLLNTFNAELTKRFAQQLNVRAGGSSPDFNMGSTSQFVDRNFRWNAQLNYNFFVQKWGAESVVLINRSITTNHEFVRGNTIDVRLLGVRQFKVKEDVILNGKAGLAYIQQSQDILNQYWVSASGGHLLNATVGADLSLAKLTFNALVQLPVWQDLNFKNQQQFNFQIGVVWGI